jgi:hypothetical protein
MGQTGIPLFPLLSALLIFCSVLLRFIFAHGLLFVWFVAFLRCLLFFMIDCI